MNAHQRQCGRGMSLVEMLVYVAVVVLVAVAAVSTTFALRDTFERLRVEREISYAATSALERMIRDIRDAESVGPGSVLDSSPGTLILSRTTAPLAVRFELSGGQVILSENGVAVGPLTPSSVAVTNLTFSHHTQAGSSTDFVRIGLTLSASGKFASTTKTFYAGAVLRGSYE